MSTKQPAAKTQIGQLIFKKLPQAMTYEAFGKLNERLAADRQTTGEEQTESYIRYTLLNYRRMKRWDKTFRLPESSIDQIKSVGRKIFWLVLTESWCGDAAPTLPVMNKIAELNPNIQLGILLRDEHLDLMERFRTEGALSIPKLISVDLKTGDILGEWGPRPDRAAQMVREYKEKHGALTPEFREELQRWYNSDKGFGTLEELLELLPLEYIGNRADL